MTLQEPVQLSSFFLPGENLSGSAGVVVGVVVAVDAETDTDGAESLLRQSSDVFPECLRRVDEDSGKDEGIGIPAVVECDRQDEEILLGEIL